MRQVPIPLLNRHRKPGAVLLGLTHCGHLQGDRIAGDVAGIEIFYACARCSSGLDFGIARVTWNRMASDPKIGRLAQLIVEKHGEEALAVVTERAIGRLTVQDYALAMVWTRVAEAVHMILPDAEPERSLWHTRVPLKELMNDRLMGVVVQDDDDRRQEVHDVLRIVKRRRREDKS